MEMEALALVAMIQHFAYYLYGTPFQGYTDHKPLEQLVASDRLNPRLRRMAYKLQHWMVEIIYLPGKHNTLEDALSREERRVREMPVKEPDVYLAMGDVEGQPPHEREEQDHGTLQEGKDTQYLKDLHHHTTCFTKTALTCHMFHTQLLL